MCDRQARVYARTHGARRTHTCMRAHMARAWHAKKGANKARVKIEYYIFTKKLRVRKLTKQQVKQLVNKKKFA